MASALMRRVLLTTTTKTAAAATNQQQQQQKRSYNNKSNDYDATIDCGKLTDAIVRKVKLGVDRRLMAGGSRPSLTVVVCWREPEARKFAQRLAKSCRRVGIDARMRVMTSAMTSCELHDVLVDVGYDRKTDAGLVALPLVDAKHLDQVHVGLDVHKDVDGFGVSYRKRIFGNDGDHLYVPAKVSAAMAVLQSCGVDPTNKITLLHGDTRNLKVMKQQILNGRRGSGSGNRHRHHQGSLSDETTVIETNGETPRELLTRWARQADVIVSEAGKPRSVTADMIKPGAHVIDMAHNHVTGDDDVTRVVGDVAYDEVRRVARGVTPVPGGIGPLSIAMILYHTFVASAKQQREKGSYF